MDASKLNPGFPPFVPDPGHPATLRKTPSYPAIFSQGLPAYEQDRYPSDPGNLQHSTSHHSEPPQADVLRNSSVPQPYRHPHFTSDTSITEASLPSSSTPHIHSPPPFNPRLFAGYKLPPPGSAPQFYHHPISHIAAPDHGNFQRPFSTPQSYQFPLPSSGTPASQPSPRPTSSLPLAPPSRVDISRYNLNAQITPPYNTDSITNLEQVAKAHLGCRNEIEALKKVVKMYHELYEEFCEWLTIHSLPEGGSGDEEDGFALICESDFHEGAGRPDGDAGEARNAGDGLRVDMEGRLEMLERLKSVMREIRERLVEAGVAIP
ncbi:hypothetical protein MMC18_001923 [Xylographa bjoerkii]|nr:hypothetical protein [Xylographa bjoerkii]